MTDSNLEFPDGFPEHFREVMEFRFSLSAETDRGCALMVASILDHKLGQLLAARLIDDPKATADFLSHSGPLGTFSSRIDAAYLFGLIGENVRRDIHLIRKIRNEFGHTHHSVNFSDQQICSRCNELFHFHSIDPTNDPRKMFVKTTMSILAVLNTDLRKIERVERGKDLYLSKDERRAHQGEIQKLAEVIMDEPEEALHRLMEGVAKLLNADKSKKQLDD